MTSLSAPHRRIRAGLGWRRLGLRELWEYRDVGWMLASRDVRLRYRQTALGVAWVVLQPILAGAIFAVIFGHFARLPSGGAPYGLFVFAGLLGWNLFAGIVQRSGGSVLLEARLITKVYFPRLLAPIAAAGSALIDFGVSLAVMAGLVAWWGCWPGVWIFFLPAAVVVVVLLGLGCGFWMAALNVRYRDFAHAMPFALQVLMYASPVVYATELVPERFRFWFWLNPLTGAIEGMRSALLGGAPGLWAPFAVSAAMAAVLFVSGAYFFRRLERSFADTL